MIYYPLSVLMLAGIRDILVISTPQDTGRFEELLGDGSQLGLNFSYHIQEKPRGIAEAFLIGEDFIGNDNVCLILGDNIFYGGGLTEKLEKVVEKTESKGGATVFGYPVTNPQRYGIVEFDENENVISIEEKPQQPKSNYAVTGLYFYDSDVVSFAQELEPSERGELEITDLNKRYLRESRLKVELLGRGFAWLDTGTHDSLLDAGEFIETIEKRQGLMVACIEEIAYRKGYINKEKLLKLAEPLSKTDYGRYLKNIAE